MQIVRHAKYIGTMIGPDGYLHLWTAPRKEFSQRVMNINASAKSLAERLCDLKINAISVLSLIGSVSAPDDATLKAENHALQCTTAGPYNAIPSNLFRVGSVCGIGPDFVGIQSISLAARYRVAACSTTLRPGIEKIRLARGHNCARLFALSEWDNEFLSPSLANSTVSAYDTVRQLDHDRKLDNAPNDKKQKIATGLLSDSLYSQDFAGPISVRVTKIFGPISRFRVADILPHMKLASNASRPGLVAGILRVLCNGMCTAQRFHNDEQEHTCQIGSLPL